MIGVVALWNDPRGYGFVRPEGATDDTQNLFVHISNCQTGNVPKVGATVEFDIGAPLKLGQRPQAIRVKLIPQKVTNSDSSGVKS
jgi:cold shock CspA family protein